MITSGKPSISAGKPSISTGKADQPMARKSAEPEKAAGKNVVDGKNPTGTGVAKPLAGSAVKPGGSTMSGSAASAGGNRLAQTTVGGVRENQSLEKIQPPVKNATTDKANEASHSTGKGSDIMAEKTSGAGKSNGKSGAAGGKTVGQQTKTAMDAVLEQNSALKTTLQQIERQFGEGAIMPLGAEKQGAIQGIPTGSLSVDMALGGQGIPRGRIIEMFGPESSGKTTLALHVIAQAQRRGGIAAFVDAEHALDPTWAKKLGVQLETLLVSQPTSGEEAMHITEMLIKSNAVDVIVVDSVAALIPKAELEGDIGDSHVGLQARLMSQSMRKLTGAIAKAKTSVIFINQIREKIGVMFGSPETTPGGRALKFFSSCRIDVRKIGALKEGEDVIGQRVRVKIVKNKVAPPFRVAEFDMMHTNGISYEGDVLDLAADLKIVVRSGAWFRYGDIQLGQGKEKARQYLIENPKITEEIAQKVLGSRDAVARPSAAVGATAEE
jgi:recombination protein RecA